MIGEDEKVTLPPPEVMMWVNSLNLNSAIEQSITPIFLWIFILLQKR
ncbi:hypothetical protein [Leeuwenhoekiella sp. LLG6367-2.1]